MWLVPLSANYALKQQYTFYGDVIHALDKARNEEIVKILDGTHQQFANELIHDFWNSLPNFCFP